MIVLKATILSTIESLRCACQNTAFTSNKKNYDRSHDLICRTDDIPL